MCVCVCCIVETGFGERMVTITESDDVQQVCLVTIGVPAVDTPINVTLIPGTVSIDGEPPPPSHTHTHSNVATTC